MKPEYRRDMEHNYMVLEAPEVVSGNEYPVRMIFANQIYGLLKCKMHIMDGKREFYYEITSKQPMNRVFAAEKIGSRDIRIIFEGIENALSAAGDFLLDDSHFILDPEYIYMDMETKEVFLCYLPFYEQDIAAAFRSFAEYILQQLDHEDQQAVLWGYAVYSQTVKENYSIKEVLQSVYKQMAKKDREEAELHKEIDGPQKAYEKVKEVPQKDCEKLPKQLLPRYKFKWQSLLGVPAAVILSGGAVTALLVSGILNLTQAGGLIFLLVGVSIYFKFGEKKVKKEKKHSKQEHQEDSLLAEYEPEISEPTMGEPELVPHDSESVPDTEAEYGETTVLNGSVLSALPVLISVQPELRENIIIGKEELLIGKLKNQVDIFLNHPGISRLHAKIERKTEGSFLTDLNSTNGTFLNGTRLQANECREVKTGDEIFFAGAGYYFKG